MPSLDISEYIDSSHGNPIEPPTAHQTLPLGPEPAQSWRFDRQTKVVRLVADANCRITFGEDPQEAKSFLPAGREVIRTVHPDSRFRVCAALASPDQENDAMSPSGAESLVKLLHLIGDAPKYQALAQKLARAEEGARAAARELGDQKAKASALAKERTAFETWVTAEHESIAETQHQIEAQREQLEAEKREHAANLEALARDRAALESSWREHEERFAEMQRLRKVLAA
jgi:hypothetical protein